MSFTATRIPNEIIEEVLTKTDLAKVIGRYVALKKNGKNYTALCPFHGEKTPSFTISTDKQLYHCFGCGEGGNAITFLTKHAKIPFYQAISDLAQEVGVYISPQDIAKNETQTKTKMLHQALKYAEEFYIKQLKAPLGLQARQYLISRGLDGKTMDEFGVGFSPNAWDGLKNYLKEKKIDDSVSLEVGLFTEKQQTGHVYDRFRHRIMFPIKDARGRTVGFGGRTLSDEKPKYLNSPETPVFHKNKCLYGLFHAEKNSKENYFILVEGYLDVLSLVQFGIHSAIATLGTATSEEHLQMLFKLRSEIIFCFDGDAAGHQAAWRALIKVLPLLQEGRIIKFIFLPEGDDPDSYIRKHGTEQFQLNIKQATSLTDYLLKHIFNSLNITDQQALTIEQKAAIIHESKTYIQKVPVGFYKKLMIQKLAHITQLDEESLEQGISGKKVFSGYSSLNTAIKKEMGTMPEHNLPTDNYSAKEGYPAKPWTAQKYFNKKQPRPNPFLPTHLSSTNNAQQSLDHFALEDRIVRILYRSPQLAALLTNFQFLKESEKNSGRLLYKCIEFLSQQPEQNLSYLHGFLHGHTLGLYLDELIARGEFVLSKEEETNELESSYRQLQLRFYQQALDKELRKQPPNIARLTELMQLQKNLKEKLS